MSAPGFRFPCNTFFDMRRVEAIETLRARMTDAEVYAAFAHDPELQARIGDFLERNPRSDSPASIVNDPAPNATAQAGRADASKEVRG